MDVYTLIETRTISKINTEMITRNYNIKLNDIVEYASNNNKTFIILTRIIKTLLNYKEISIQMMHDGIKIIRLQM